MALIDTTGIRPIDRRQPTDDVSRVRRREEGTSSAFRPQTNVALKTAIQDLAGTLSKISSEEKTGIEKMPKEIGDVVKNILRQALSMDFRWINSCYFRGSFRKWEYSPKKIIQ